VWPRAASMFEDLCVWTVLYALCVPHADLAQCTIDQTPPPRPPSPLCRDLHFVYTNMPALDSCQWLG